MNQHAIQTKRKKPLLNVSEVSSSKIRRIGAAYQDHRDWLQNTRPLWYSSGEAQGRVAASPRDFMDKFEGQLQECEFCGFKWRLYCLSRELSGPKVRKTMCHICYEGRCGALDGFSGTFEPNCSREEAEVGLNSYIFDGGDLPARVDERTRRVYYDKLPEDETVSGVVCDGGVYSDTVTDDILLDDLRRIFNSSLDGNESMGIETPPSYEEHVPVGSGWSWEVNPSECIGEEFYNLQTFP